MRRLALPYILPITLAIAAVSTGFAAGAAGIVWLCWGALTVLMGALLWLLFYTPQTRSVGGESIISGFRHTGFWRLHNTPGSNTHAGGLAVAFDGGDAGGADGGGGGD